MKKQVLGRLIDNGDMDIAYEYGESDYTLEENKKAILFANWNRLDKYPNFMNWIEESYEIEWDDEWIIDPNSNKAYRSQSNSYGWQQQYRISDCGDLITPDSDIEDWINFCKVTANNLHRTPQCLPDFIDVLEL